MEIMVANSNVILMSRKLFSVCAVGREVDLCERTREQENERQKGVDKVQPLGRYSLYHILPDLQLPVYHCFHTLVIH